MTIEITELSAALFKNDFKTKDSQPDYVGKVSRDREHLYKISAWLNETKDGKKYLSIKFSDLKPNYKPEPKFNFQNDAFDGGDDGPF